MKIAYLDILYDGSDAFEDITEEMKKYVDPERDMIDYRYVTGTDNLEYLSFEALVLPKIIKKIDELRREEYDAVIVGCFFDPAVEAARELFDDIIVIGPGEASILTAAEIGNSFSIITPTLKTMPQTRRCVERVGLTSKLASIRALNIRVADMHRDPGIMEKRMREVIKEALDHDEAEVIILGCTYEAGRYRALQDAFSVPVIDPTIAALFQSHLWNERKRYCGWDVSRKCFYSKPPADETEKYLGFRI